jgi:hypothetical protein
MPFYLGVAGLFQTQPWAHGNITQTIALGFFGDLIFISHTLAYFSLGIAFYLSVQLGGALCHFDEI